MLFMFTSIKLLPLDILQQATKCYFAFYALDMQINSIAYITMYLNKILGKICNWSEI